MKKIYKKPTFLYESFAVDRIMNGTGEEEDIILLSTDLNPLVNSTGLQEGIVLGDNNTLHSINYKNFILK